MPSEGIISAPKPNKSTNGATFVIRPGTSEPMVPNMDAAAETLDWRDCVPVCWLDVVAVELDEDDFAPSEPVT